MKRKYIGILLIAMFFAMSFSMVASGDDLVARKRPPSPPGQDDGGDDPTGDGGEPITGKRLALVIGISDYDGTDSDLQYADDDAKDWQAYLRGEGYTVTTLIDQQATAQNILNAFQDLADAEVAGDGVVITYSGHGSYSRTYRESGFVSSDLYLVLSSQIKAITDTFDSKHVYFFDDACNQGTFSDLVNPGWLAVVGSTTRTYTYDGTSDMANGILTYYMVHEGLMMYNIVELASQHAVDSFNSATPGKASMYDSYTGDFYF